MLNEGKEQAAAFRVGLWQRADALGPRVRGHVGARTSLSATDLEDLWAELLAQAVRQPGSPGALPHDAETWPDAQLAAWLRRALARDVIDERRRRVDSDGNAWVSGTPLDDLAQGVHQSIWRGLGDQSPEEVVLGRAAALQRTEDVRAVVGQEAAQLMLAEAAGASGSEQREMLQMSVGRWRSLKGQVEFAATALRSRAQAVVLWLWPEASVRWVLGLLGGASTALLSAGTATKLAASVALIAGAVGGATAVTSDPPRAMTPALTAKAAAAASSSAGSLVVLATQRAAVSVRADADAARARQQADDRRRAQLQRQRRARERAAERRRRQAAAEKAAGVTAAAAQPSAAQSAPAGSAAATEFLPSGR